MWWSGLIERHFRIPLSLIASAVFAGAGWAQTASPNLPPAKAQQLVDLLNDPEVKAWLQGKAAAPAKSAPASITDAFSEWVVAVRERIGDLISVIPRLPDEVRNAASVVSREVNFGHPGLVLTLLAILVAAGLGAEWVVRRLLFRVSPPSGRWAVVTAFLLDLVCLITFGLASAGLFLVFEWPPLLHRIVLVLLLAIIAFRGVRITARWVLATNRSVTAAEPAALSSDADETSAYWLNRTSLIAGLLLFGWAITNLMPLLGFSAAAATLVALLLGLGILAVAVDVVWRRPGNQASRVIRALQTVYLIGLWLLWVAGMFETLWLGIFAFALPSAVRLAGDTAEQLARKVKYEGAFGAMFDVLVGRGARALVIVAAVAWLAYIWSVGASRFAGNAVFEKVVTGIFNAVVILLVADLVWQLCKAFIAYRIAATTQEGTEEEIARRARLRTLLPIFRNALAALIIVVAALTILSGLGVQIAPLIAGAGIFGVAIGFGSQTMVRDVLSGVFYMLDDAFRVGDYIQSGSYKGTVESFSLRSVRLRHQRGPVFTVPFGQLGAVQNMSRDWSVEKMMINVPYDTDVQLARKLINKIGQELAQDPEFAPDTIEPLKMQGIDDFGDYAIALRLKLKTKPGTQSGMKRKAYLMIKQAFEENGIRIGGAGITGVPAPGPGRGSQTAKLAAIS